MKKQKNSCRSVRWMQRNDFRTNPECRAYLTRLFDRYGINYQFKGNCIIIWCDDAEQYRITLDEDNTLVKLIDRRTGEVHHYPADNPYTQMCLDIVRASSAESNTSME